MVGEILRGTMIGIQATEAILNAHHHGGTEVRQEAGVHQDMNEGVVEVEVTLVALMLTVAVKGVAAGVLCAVLAPSTHGLQ